MRHDLRDDLGNYLWHDIWNRVGHSADGHRDLCWRRASGAHGDPATRATARLRLVSV
jgi:hypothetical protein